MRVTIEHREEATGVSRSKRNYFVDCNIQLSEEERAIIRARGLQEHFFTTEGARPPRTSASFAAAPALKGCAPLIGVAGFIWGLFGGGTPAGLMLFGAIGMFAYGFYIDLQPMGAAEEQTITLGRLLRMPKFSVFAPSPSQAKEIDAQLREKLANVKSNLVASAEIEKKQTFEL
jgi:hypothetical protein